MPDLALNQRPRFSYFCTMVGPSFAFVVFTSKIIGQLSLASVPLKNWAYYTINPVQPGTVVKLRGELAAKGHKIVITPIAKDISLPELRNFLDEKGCAFSGYLGNFEVPSVTISLFLYTNARQEGSI